MKFEKLQPGMVVYDVGRRKMGNTTISTVSVWQVHIISVNSADLTVEASWNGNPPRRFHSRIWSKWRLSKPILIRSASGRCRLATRAEIAEAKADRAAE